MKHIITLVVLLLIAVGAIVVIVWNLTKHGGGETGLYQIPEGRYDCVVLTTAGSTILRSPKFPALGSATGGDVATSATRTAAAFPTPAYQDEQTFFGVPFTIGVYGGQSRSVIKLVVDDTFKLIGQIEKDLGANQEEGLIWKINHEAAKAPVKMSDDLWFIWTRAQEVTLYSGATFDLTDSAVKELWRAALAEHLMPPPEMIKERQALLGMKYVEVDEKKHTIRFKKPGVSIDLGHMLRGFAVDRAARKLRQAGFKEGFIRAGDDYYLLGRPDKQPFDLAIPDPFKPETAKFAFQSDRPAVAMGGYFREWWFDRGRIITDLIDAHTGSPSGQVPICVVTGPDMMTCAALADALGVVGETKALRFIAKFNPREKEEVNEEAEKAKGRAN
jgi:thiamine biosynthesis lipoprotein